ncbi:MAG: hypothetical protein WCN98_01175 [Verrucomicrobiaceae bacterium]
MNTMHLVLLLTLLVGTLPVFAADPSPEIQQVLKERLVGKHDLKVKDLTGSKPTPEQNKRLEEKPSYEVYHVPQPKGAADYYAYSIYRFNETGEIWIVRSGGFAGRTELFVIPKAKN